MALVGRLSPAATMFKPASLHPVLFFAGLLFVMDALVVNVVCLSLLVGIFQVVVGLPLLFLKQDGRRQRLRNIGIFVGVLVMVVVMVNVNAYIAPLHADRLIEAIESYRAATGVYPKKLDDLVPKFIDHVPWAQYTLGGNFCVHGRWYSRASHALVQSSWNGPSHLPLQDQGLGIFGLTGGLVGGSPFTQVTVANLITPKSPSIAEHKTQRRNLMPAVYQIRFLPGGETRSSTAPVVITTNCRTARISIYRHRQCGAESATSSRMASRQCT